VTGGSRADLTALFTEYGALWEITRTPDGYQARRRPLPLSPLVFTADTVAALRELLTHGYDTAELADLLRDFAAGWDIEHLDLGSAWVAVSRDGGYTQVITASDLGSLRTNLTLARDETDGAGQ
jgi:hypothetical protein